LSSVLVQLDKRTRFLNRVGLGGLRRVARRTLARTVAREVAVNIDGLVFAGSIQHRGYLDGLRAGSVEPGTARLLATAMTSGTVFVDVGAFLGVYAITAAVRGAEVVAVEPNLTTRRYLERNVARNGVDVTIHPYALSDRAGEAQFFVGDGNESSSGLVAADSNTRPVTVETRRLDDLIEHVDVVKIDVEGAEVAVLDGMRRIVSAGRPMTIVAECNPDGLAAMGTSPEALVGRLEAHGFTVSQIDEQTGGLAQVHGSPVITSAYVNLYATR
jgi:FkbM family methyltransferase